MSFRFNLFSNLPIGLAVEDIDQLVPELRFNFLLVVFNSYPIWE